MRNDITIEEVWDAQTMQYIDKLEQENNTLREILEYLCKTSMSLLGEPDSQNNEQWFDKTVKYTHAYTRAMNYIKEY